MHWYFFKRFPSICRNTIKIVLTKDSRFMSPWLLFHKFNNSKYYSHTINYCLLYYITYTIMMVFCLFFLYEKVCFHAIRYFFFWFNHKYLYHYVTLKLMFLVYCMLTLFLFYLSYWHLSSLHILLGFSMSCLTFPNYYLKLVSLLSFCFVYL